MSLVYVALAFVCGLVAILYPRLGSGSAAGLRWVLAAVAVVAMVMAIIGLGSGGPGNSGPPDMEAFEEIAGWKLGTVLADQVKPGPILVLRMPTDPRSEEASAARLRGFTKACRGYTIRQVGPAFDETDQAPSGDFTLLPEREFAAAVAETCGSMPDLVAVVSLLHVMPEVTASWREGMPPVYGFSAGPAMDWANGIQKDVVNAVVRYKPGINTRIRTPKGLSPDEAFDIRFVLVTRDNLKPGM